MRKEETAVTVEPISATKALVCYHATTDRIGARILDVSGTTITPGAQLEVSANTTVSQYNVDVIDSTHGIASYLDATGNFVKARVLLISGSTLTVPGSEYNISATGATTSIPTEVKMQNTMPQRKTRGSWKQKLHNWKT